MFILENLKLKWMISGVPPWLRKPPYAWICRFFSGKFVVTSRRDLTGTMVRSGGNHPQMDLLFHVSEILQLTQIFGIFPMGNQSGIFCVFVGFLKQVQVCTMVKIAFFAKTNDIMWLTLELFPHTWLGNPRAKWSCIVGKIIERIERCSSRPCLITGGYTFHHPHDRRANPGE